MGLSREVDDCIWLHAIDKLANGSVVSDVDTSVVDAWLKVFREAAKAKLQVVCTDQSIGLTETRAEGGADKT